MKPINPIQRYVEQTFDAIDKAMQIAVDVEAPDSLLAQLAHAHVGASRTEMVMHSIDVPGDAERVYADEARKQLPIRRDQFEAAQNALPALKKQPTSPEGYKLRPGLGKKLRKPIEYDCVTCGAKAGELCFQMSGAGGHGEPTEERKKPGTYHQARYNQSKAANDKLRREYDRQHFGTEA